MLLLIQETFYNIHTKQLSVIKECKNCLKLSPNNNVTREQKLQSFTGITHLDDIHMFKYNRSVFNEITMCITMLYRFLNICRN